MKGGDRLGLGECSGDSGMLFDFEEGVLCQAALAAPSSNQSQVPTPRLFLPETRDLVIISL